MKNIFYSLIALQLIGCASANISQNFTMLAFDEKADAQNTKNVGTIEGKDCLWYAFGYPLGEQPTVRTAIQNAVHQRKDSLIPGQKAETQGPPLKLIKNMSVEGSGFSAWIVARSCVVVTGVGLQ